MFGDVHSALSDFHTLWRVCQVQCPKIEVLRIICLHRKAEPASPRLVYLSLVHNQLKSEV